MSNKNFSIKNGLTVGTTEVINSSGAWIGGLGSIQGAYEANVGAGLITVTNRTNSAFDQANLAYATANALMGGTAEDGIARALANSAITNSSNAFNQANLAFNKANSALANTTGTFNGALSVTGRVITLATGSDEGGEMLLSKPSSNTVLNGLGIVIDSYQNKIRFFEDGSPNRGAYIDLTECANSAGTNLLSGVGGGSVTSVAGANGAISNTQILSGILNVDGSGSGLDADLLDGLQSTAFANASFANTIATTAEANVGAGLIATTNTITGAYQANVGAGLISAKSTSEANVGAGLISAKSTSEANVGAGLIATTSSITGAYEANVGAVNIAKYDKTGGTISGDVNITGNLTVSGQRTFANTTTVNLGDNIITLNADIPQDQSPTENSGIEIDRGSASNVGLIWNETSDKWTFTNDGSTYEEIASDGRLSSAFGQANLAYTSANTAVTSGEANVGAGLIATTSSITGAYQANVGAGLIATTSSITSAYQANVGAGLISAKSVSEANVGAGLIATTSSITGAYEANVGAGLISTTSSITGAYQANVGAGLISAKSVSEANVGAGLITVTGQTNSAFSQANLAYSRANSAYDVASLAYNTANSLTGGTAEDGIARALANAAYELANTKLDLNGGTITGDLHVSGNLTTSGNITTISGKTGTFYGESGNGFQALYAGIQEGYTLQEQTVIQATGNYGDYVQLNIQNLDGGVNASSDLVATNDNYAGDAYIDVGINSTGYNNPDYTIQKAGDGYVYVNANTETGGGNLVFSTTAVGRDIVFSTGGTLEDNEIARFKEGVGLVMQGKPIKFADGTTQNTAGISTAQSQVIFDAANTALSYLNQQVKTTSQVQFDTVYAANNGFGLNFKVGDDAWIGDYNVANTIKIKGQQDQTIGYVSFGSNTSQLGASGTGQLTYGGNTVWHAGNDGSGSGLDADLLDGLNSSAFANASFANTITETTQANVGAGLIATTSSITSAYQANVGAGLIATVTSGQANVGSAIAQGQANVGAGLISTKSAYESNVGAGLIATASSGQANVGAGLIATKSAYEANVGEARIATFNHAENAYNKANNALANTGGTISGSVNVTGSVTVGSYVDINTAPAKPARVEGRLFYDNEQKALAYYNESDMTGQLLQESVIRVHNQTGTTIGEGKAVYVTGASSANGFPSVALANSAIYESSEVIGITTTTIANSGFGYVTAMGKVNGLDTHLVTEGSEVYLSATDPGGWTTTAPASPAAPVRLGIVAVSDITNGSILVDITFREGANKTSGAILFAFDEAIHEDPTQLYYDHTNHRLGVGTNTPSANLHVAGDALFTANVQINGNLIISNAQSISTTTLTVGGNTIVLNDTVTGSPTSNAEIRVNRGNSANVYIKWDEEIDEWIMYEAGAYPSGHILHSEKTAKTWADYAGFATYEKLTHPIGADLANSTNELAKTAFNQANTSLGIAQSAFAQANLAYAAANSASGSGSSEAAFAQANLAFDAANSAVTVGQANVGAGLIATTSSITSAYQANVGAGLITVTGAYQANVGAGLIATTSSITGDYQSNVGAGLIATASSGQANVGSAIAQGQANVGAGLIATTSSITGDYQSNVGAGLIATTSSITSAYQANVGAGLISTASSGQANVGAGLIATTSSITSAYQANVGAGLISTTSSITSAYQANVGAGLIASRSTDIVTTSTTASTSSSTGALRVTGGAGIGGDVYVGGAVAAEQYRLAINALGSVSGATTINLNNGSYVTATATGAVTWTVTNATATAQGFILKLTNGGAGSQSWMSGIKWPGGTAPTLQASGVDVLTFITDDGGTTWFGVLSMSNSL